MAAKKPSQVMLNLIEITVSYVFFIWKRLLNGSRSRNGHEYGPALKLTNGCLLALAVREGRLFDEKRTPLCGRLGTLAGSGR